MYLTKIPKSTLPKRRHQNFQNHLTKVSKNTSLKYPKVQPKFLQILFKGPIITSSKFPRAAHSVDRLKFLYSNRAIRDSNVNLEHLFGKKLFMIAYLTYDVLIWNVFKTFFIEWSVWSNSFFRKCGTHLLHRFQVFLPFDAKFPDAIFHCLCEFRTSFRAKSGKFPQYLLRNSS